MNRTLLLLFLLISFNIQAQDSEIQFDRLSFRDGLLDHSINCIIKDHNGFIWIGGVTGLYKYDGYDFTNYQYQPGDGKNQYFKEVYRIKEDRFGLLWILSENGIIIFDPVKGRFSKLFTYSDEKKSDIYNYRPDILIDSDQNIWATFRKGIIQITYDSKVDDFLNLDNPTEGIKKKYFHSQYLELPFSDTTQHNLVTKIFEDKNHNLLIGATTELFYLIKSQNKIIRLTTNDEINGGSFSYVRSIIQDDDNSYLIAASDFLYHLKGLNSEVNKSLDVFSMITRYRISQDEKPISLFVTSNQDLLVGTSNDIFKLIKQDNTNGIIFEKLGTEENDPEFYGYTKTIRDFFEDNSGVIWVVQDYYGVTRFNLRGTTFNSYRNLIIKNFKSTDINPIYKDKYQNLWIGTYGGGLYKIENGSSKVRQYDMYGQKNNILCISELSDGLFWIGTDKGLVEFNASSGKSTEPSASALRFINQNNTFIYDILKDNDQIYFASSNGVLIFDTQLNSLFHYPSVRNDTVFDSKFIAISLSRMKRGGILAGIDLYGIYNIIFENSKLVYSQITDNQSLIDNGIDLGERHRLFEDSDGMIWIVDYSGLHSLNAQTSEIKNYRLFDKIDFPVAWSIIEDKHKNLWIGTQFGLCCFNKVTEKVKVYDQGNGLPITIHGLNSVFKDNSGRFYFGGIGGFYDFQPDSMKVNSVVPPVVITDVLLSGKSLKDDTIQNIRLTSDIPYLKSIKLKYNQNDLTFKFSVLNYNQPDKNEYSYKLEGFQDNWVKTLANNRQAAYLKLKPGHYVFQVKGSNNDGIWNEEGASLQVIIQKPWWTTNAAFSVYIIFLAFGIIGTFRWRLRRLRREKKELEKMVRLRTKEITAQSKKISDQNDLLEIQNKKIREEEELKSRLFLNISHEFRTPLTLIKSPVEELLREKHLDENDRNALDLVNRNAQRLLNLVNQLLDISKFEGNKMNLEISENDVMLHLNYVTGLFISVAEVKKIEFKRFIDDTKLITWFDKDKLEKIITNLLSNAFKFTPIGGKIYFEAKYIQNTDSGFPLILETSVTDNGPGIPESSCEKIFDRFYQVEQTSKTEITPGTGLGLSLSRELARLMHGEITVQSILHKGSTFTVRIPLGKEHLEEEEYFVCENNATDNTKIIENIDPQIFVTQNVEKDSKNEGGANPIILIVDDNGDLRQMLSDNLKSVYKTNVASDGDAGMKKALKLVPDLIITDLMMPKMDGVEFCKKLKENEITSHIPVIMLTSKASVQDKISGFQIGADDYIPKPFDFSELKARIANLLEQRIKLKKQFGKTISLDPSDIAITSADEIFLKKAIGIIEEYLKDESFDLVKFREQMNLTRSTLSRKLNALTGQSPTEFIRTIRLKRAAQLIKQNFGNVTEVAFEVGFNDVSYFNKSFKKCFGLSPSEYIQSENTEDLHK